MDFKFLKGTAVAAFSMLLLSPLSSFAEKAQSAPTPEQIRQEHARIKEENKKKDAELRQGYLKAVPQPDNPTGGKDETDVVKMHSAREWYLLTYPTGKLPSQPWGKAKKWVAGNVMDAQPWSGEGLSGPAESEGIRGITAEAIVAPGTNTWVSYGPRGLDTVGTTNNAYRYGITAGRVAAGGLAVDPNNPTVAYAAFAAGGLWKTTTLGLPTVVWTPLWDEPGHHHPGGERDRDRSDRQQRALCRHRRLAGPRPVRRRHHEVDRRRPHLDAARRRRLHPLLADPPGRRQPLGQPERQGDPGRPEQPEHRPGRHPVRPLPVQ